MYLTYQQMITSKVCKKKQKTINSLTVEKNIDQKTKQKDNSTYILKPKNFKMYKLISKMYTNY